MTVQELEDEIKADWDENGIPAVYDGPSALEIATYNASVSVRDGAVNAGVWLYNHTYGWATGHAAEYVSTTTPPNPPRIMDTIMRVHGEQLFKHGAFNADPHAGNFLLLPDDRIGLIDYGSTKKLTRGERLLTAVLYVALSRGDRSMVFDICRNGMGRSVGHGSRGPPWPRRLSSNASVVLCCRGLQEQIHGRGRHLQDDSLRV